MSRPINTQSGLAAVTIASADATIAVPPAADLSAGIVSHWNKRTGSVPEGDIEIASDASEAFTDLEMFSGTLVDETAADDTFTIANATDIVTETAHGLITGAGPFNLINAGGALPAGSSATQDYFARKIDANTYYLYTSRAAALLGGATGRLNVTDDGTGTHTRAAAADCQTIEYAAMGKLGQIADGAVTVEPGYPWRQGFYHQPHVDVYGVASATGPAGNITAKVRPRKGV